MVAAEQTKDSTAVVHPKKKKGRKRKISKHIAEARAAAATAPTEATEGGGERRLPIAEAPVASTATKSATPTSSTKRSKKAVAKDPAEAAAYLTAWQRTKHQTTEGSTAGDAGAAAIAWKFNKNTQSWLIRHMYEADRVSKHTFGVLLDYLKAGDAKTVQRCLDEATRRALRYQQQSSRTEEEEKEGGGERKKPEEKWDGDNARWNRLDEHDRRKEYKRARKVLDLLS